LNGYVSNNTGLSTSGWFEYSTSSTFYNATTFQYLGTTVNTPISAYISGLVPNTTYYFRALAQTSNGITTGNIVNFRTLPVTSTIIVTEPKAQIPLVEIQIATTSKTVSMEEDVCFTVFYKNISNKNLTNAVLTIKLPSGVTFKNTTAGFMQGDSLVVNVGSLPAHGSGFVLIESDLNNSVSKGDTLVTTATMTYSLSNGNQDSVIAYATQIVEGENNDSSDSFFGDGFFPSNLLGWLLLVLAVLVIIVLFRRFGTRPYHHHRDVPPHPRG